MKVHYTALIPLDPLAAAIIVSDVAINSYALYRLALPFGFPSLQLQTLFGGFLLGAIGFLADRW